MREMIQLRNCLLKIRLKANLKSIGFDYWLRWDDPTLRLLALGALSKQMEQASKKAGVCLWPFHHLLPSSSFPI